MKFDVLIVGGGPAGLSAALILGRCHREALLCDEGHQRNLSSHAIHGLLGREGRHS
ncbi:FAD-binding protein [Bradyrhizobium sp. SRL28]|uniref:FAD-binding protein n=1 Tax=Bradyrhizobium sp. SRL28 TaxID=2836178 RepID=UPI001BDE37B4|nr:FAD-binding protein [Bradyrhizobium sp. SRL28]